MKLKWIVSLAVIAAVVGCAHGAGKASRGAQVAQNGKALADIVISSNATITTRHAAEELQRFLGEMTLATFRIIESSNQDDGVILLADEQSAKKPLPKVPVGKLGKEGYNLQARSGRVVIAGGLPRGVLYGVYGLLEDHLGCRWFTPDVSRIPKYADLTIAPMNETVVPDLEYREPFVMDCYDGDWAVRNRVNSNAARLEEKHGGKIVYYGFVHTFNQLVPPETYFDQHPEYFSLIDGKRLKDRSQLCCTNEDVVRIVTEDIRKRMREHPEATVFSVSQNDWHNPCQCDTCSAIAKAEGSEMGPMLYLVNRVAKAVATEFPDKLIDTLAYQYTRKTPKHVRPEPNVVIRLCSIECCFAHSFESCDSTQNEAFEKDVKAWAKASKRLWVWNYDTSFANYLTPYPNLRVRNDNIKFYVRNNVRGIFEQDVYTTLNGELSPLSGYLNAKLLWNPNYDEDTAIYEFLKAVYGAAAKPIRKYIDLIHDKVENDNLHMSIWIGPEHSLLDGGVLERADALWESAEAAVAAQPDVLERVQTARLSVDFAILERMRARGLQIYEANHQLGKVMVKADVLARVNRFFETAKRAGVSQIREGNGDIELYKKEWDAVFNVETVEFRSSGDVSGLKPGLTFRCYDGSWEALPDFASLQPVESGIAESITHNVTKRKEHFGLVFEGYIQAPADGVYIFECRSNDGSKLYIGDTELINHDGLHGLTGRPGFIALKKGAHPIRVTYFESGGAEALEVYWEGPGLEKQVLQPADLFRSEN